MPKRLRGSRYTPVAKRNDRPDAIAFLLRNYPQLTEAQVGKLLGTTKETIQKVRERSHWNSANIKPRDPVILGLCSQTDLNAAVAQANERLEREGRAVPPPPPPETGRGRLTGVGAAALAYQSTWVRSRSISSLTCSFSIFSRDAGSSLSGRGRWSSSKMRARAPHGAPSGRRDGSAGSWLAPPRSTGCAASGHCSGRGNGMRNRHWHWPPAGMRELWWRSARLCYVVLHADRPGLAAAQAARAAQRASRPRHGDRAPGRQGASTSCTCSG